MAQKVLNTSSGNYLKRSQAEARIEKCFSAWTGPFSIRDLSLQEAIQARFEQSTTREPLPMSELPGLRYDPPASDKNWDKRKALLKEAGIFVSEQSADAPIATKKHRSRRLLLLPRVGGVRIEPKHTLEQIDEGFASEAIQ